MKKFFLMYFKSVFIKPNKPYNIIINNIKKIHKNRFFSSVQSRILP